MINWCRIFICISVFGISLFLYLDKLNDQNALKLQIPLIEKEIHELSQQNVELAFQLENFKNPQHLLELAQQPEYSHLKFPFMEEVMIVSERIAQRYENKQDEVEVAGRVDGFKWPFYLGTK